MQNDGDYLKSPFFLKRGDNMRSCYTCKYILAGYSGDGWNEPQEFEMDCKKLEAVTTEEAEEKLMNAMDKTYMNDDQDNECEFYDAGDCSNCGKPIGQGKVYEVMGYYENRNTCSQECYEADTKREREFVREMMS